MGFCGQKIREIRADRKLLLRQVAAFLDVDMALISKAERGLRNLNRDQVIKLSQLFNSSQDELITLWLCDRIMDAVGNDPMAVQGIKKALNKIDN